jgi:orotate phosphoribosyltransferase
MTPLKDIIQAQYLHKADPGESYTLSSGEKSDHYFDIKAMMGDGKHIARLAVAMWKKIREENINFRSIGGTELGGIPLATALQELYDDIPVCFIRKADRYHGMKRRIEGVPESPILLVDDVLYSGNSLIQADFACKIAEYKIAGCLVVINRFKGDPEKFMGFPIYSLFEDRDFGF